MEENYLAYFKYSGEGIENGYLDLKKSADALNGIDGLLRYHLNKNIPELANVDYELPVRVRKGSWETLIPENMGEWVGLILGTGITTYTYAALKEMAKNDFKDRGFKDLVKQIIKGIKWSIQIAKHMGTTSKKTFDDVIFKDEVGITFIGIKNEAGNILYVPKMYLELFSELPPHIFNKLSVPIEKGRELFIDFSEQNKYDIDDTSEVSIDLKNKNIFFQEEEENEILFPELEHGMFVELDGHVTRGNEKSNTIGFLYKDHILTCYPETGNISKHKVKLFTNCQMKGFIDRKDQKGFFIEKRPRIKFVELLGTEKDENKQQRLF